MGWVRGLKSSPHGSPAIRRKVGAGMERQNTDCLRLLLTHSRHSCVYSRSRCYCRRCWRWRWYSYTWWRWWPASTSGTWSASSLCGAGISVPDARCPSCSHDHPRRGSSRPTTASPSGAAVPTSLETYTAYKQPGTNAITRFILRMCFLLPYYFFPFSLLSYPFPRCFLRFEVVAQIQLRDL